MKYNWIIIVLLLTSCGGSLTDEQRKRLRQGMEINAIRKVSEAQITESALILGRAISATVEKSQPIDRRVMDSLQRSYAITIQTLLPGDSVLHSMEGRIIEAYAAGAGHVELDDNVQRIGKDTLLYTRPMMKTNPDGSMEFSYAIGIRFPRKVVVLSIRD
jgi:hypothetical protein